MNIVFTGVSHFKIWLQLQVLISLNSVFCANFTDGDVVKMPLVEYDFRRQYGAIDGAVHSVMPNSIVKFTVENIPPPVKFILFQTHSHLYNVSLSYSQEFIPHRYVNGTNLGLVELIGAENRLPINFFLHNNNEVNVSILVALQAYGKNVPIPGGCNMEFFVETAPYLQLSYNPHVVIVDSQRASFSNDPFCEMSYVNPRMYHAYVTERDFTSETYFATLRNMMSVTNISLHAQEISPSDLNSPLRRMYSAYCGTGSVHAAIAAIDGYASVYVPAFTYACDPTTDSCEVLKTPFSKVLCAVILFIGLMMCLFGHKFFKTEMFLLGCISGGLVAHILLSIFSDLDYTVNLISSLVLGAALGIIWLYVWCFCGSPLLSVLLATLALGFIFTATMFYAGIADYNFLQSDLNFWVLFSSLMLIVSVLLIPSNMKANIVSCAVLGAYAFIIPVDHYIGSNLKYITVNMIRRATVPYFRKAFVNPAFQFKDLILTFVWVGLALTGVMMQCCQQIGRPPFPPPPNRNRRRQRHRRSQVPIRTSRNIESSPLLTEASPLLTEANVTRVIGPYFLPENQYSPMPPSYYESSDQISVESDTSGKLSKLRTYLLGLFPPRSGYANEIRTAPTVAQYEPI